MWIFRILLIFMVAAVNAEKVNYELEGKTDIAPPTLRAKEQFHSMTWDRFYNVTEIYTWLDTLAKNYPEKVKTVVLGYSVEQRELKGIVINFHPDRKRKLIAVIEAGLYAYDWHSIASATWIIKELLSSNETNIKSLAQAYEWHIMLVTNPDGYAYALSNPGIPWLKNRNPAYNKTCNPGGGKDDAVGVDLTRNFGVSWETNSLKDPCSYTFIGPHAFSEPETKAIARHLITIRKTGKIIYYIALTHAWWGNVLLPYTYLRSPIDDKDRPANYNVMHKIAVNATEKLKQRYGTVCDVGTLAGQGLEPRGGSSIDWALKRLNVSFSCILGLGRSETHKSPVNITRISEETMDFLVEMDRAAQSLGLYSQTTTRHNFCTPNEFYYNILQLILIYVRAVICIINRVCYLISQS